ncbi:MAG: T9SS type A sorting domain-containing protein [Chitinophagaceae bacterium]|nr:MAG: T9SS type A sorting domain-containing protein [Chitinophagaceae bacterium]
MKTGTLPRIILTAFAVASLSVAGAQQWVVQNKDQTRPNPNEQDITGSYNSTVALPFSGYNEINWTSGTGSDATRFVVEYSIDGLQFQTAAEQVATGNTSSYTVKHYTQSNEPLLYRIRSVNSAGKSATSRNFMVDGVPLAPLRIITNTTNSNVLNVNSNWPINRVNIFSLDGTQVLARDLNGQREFIPIAIPDLGKGMYIVHFLGDGWKHSEKILIP